MLRITTERPTGDPTILRLEGRVVGPWVEELARSCAAARESGRGLDLDMASVSFLDREAVRLVRRLKGEGVAVLGCSSFVREQLVGDVDDAASDG